MFYIVGGGPDDCEHFRSLQTGCVNLFPVICAEHPDDVQTQACHGSCIAQYPRKAQRQG